jgi:3-hydroxyisobutyrate dehydrogenase-like beta-hydroxyacid dehydrogenase
MDTPYGQIVKNLMKEGAQLGVSSRGMGTLKPNKNGVNEVQSDFQLATAADIVADPSAPDAYVRGVMESCEWVYNIASGNWEAVSAIEEVVDTGRRSSKRLEERKLELFNKFLNAIR